MTDRPTLRMRRALFAVCAAALALVAALVAAVGPTRGEHAEYSWPPATLPSSTPTHGWYAPLPLLNRVPAAIEIRLPCGLSPPLESEGVPTVIATARWPEATDALRIALAADSLSISVGESKIAAVPWPARCPLAIAVRNGELRLPLQTVLFSTGAPSNMPVVTGLFSSLDLRRGEPPELLVRTRTYATSWNGRQVVAGLLATVLVCAVLFGLARTGGWGRQRRIREQVALAWRARDATDAVVVGAVLVWWIVAPTFTDDGWLWVQQRVLSETGVDSIYFNNWGLGFPVGFWLIWLGQWTTGSTTELIFMRVPALAAALVAWPLCRWCVHHAVGGRGETVVRWVLAGAFVVGVSAWSMTLRLEPFLSLLALVSLAAMVSFATSPRLLPLAIAVPAAILAATAHPVGIVATAPLLAAAPELVRWLRGSWKLLSVALAALVLAGLALAVVLFTVDSDLATRLESARIVDEDELRQEPWWREYVRYTRFDSFGGETAVRHLSLALLLASVLAMVTRVRSRKTGVLLLPAGSVAVALALLAFVSSKWPWHFGTLVALGAVATAVEVARLIRERDAAGASLIRPALAFVVIAVVAIWSWDAKGEWSKVDLQEARWAYVFGIGEYLVWVAVPFFAAALVAVLFRPRWSAWVTTRISVLAVWSLVAVMFAAVAATAGILIYDAAVSPWTPTRQNLTALVDKGGCGLADQLDGEPGLVDRIADGGTSTLLVPAVGLYFPCATIPLIDGGVVQLPQLVAHEPTLGAWPLETRHGPFNAVQDLYALREIARGPNDVVVLAVVDQVPGFARADADRLDQPTELVRWKRG